MDMPTLAHMNIPHPTLTASDMRDALVRAHATINI
jgi:hypothetical protein